jgi:hypothetical protein
LPALPPHPPLQGTLGSFREEHELRLGEGLPNLRQVRDTSGPALFQNPRIGQSAASPVRLSHGPQKEEQEEAGDSEENVKE